MVGSTNGTLIADIRTKGPVNIGGVIQGGPGSEIEIDSDTARLIFQRTPANTTPQTDQAVLKKAPDAIQTPLEPFKKDVPPSQKGIPEVNPLEPKKFTEEGLQVDKQAVFKAMKTNMAETIAEIKGMIPEGLDDLREAGFKKLQDKKSQDVPKIYKAAEKLSAAFRKNIPEGVTLSLGDVKEFFASIKLPPIVKDLALEDMIRKATKKKVN